ncbi:MAG: hypothetical protein ACRDZ8_11870 [Acidimicrobiales bacterium]
MPAATTPRDIADKAVALATGSDKERTGAADALIKLAGNERDPLEQARKVLVGRIRIRSDDFGATAGLTVLNTALSKIGYEVQAQWKPRKWLLPR